MNIHGQTNATLLNHFNAISLQVLTQSVEMKTVETLSFSPR